MSDTENSGLIIKLYRFFRSVRLALVLILAITVLSLFSTLIPQNMEPGFYNELAGGFAGTVITVTGLDSVFRSPLFITLSLLFFLNLSVCTASRLHNRLKNNAPGRFGPDILHLGLLVLIIGGLSTAAGRQETDIYMKAGDTLELPGGYSLDLKDFEFQRYLNGTPKDWISTLTLKKEDSVIKDNFPLEVNRPMKAGRMKIYQASYRQEKNLFISDREGTVYRLKQGQHIPTDEGDMVFTAIDSQDSTEAKAVFTLYRDASVVRKVELAVSDYVDKYLIAGIENELYTGLKIVIDPGYYIILAGLLFLAAGLFLTYFQKAGDNAL